MHIAGVNWAAVLVAAAAFFAIGYVIHMRLVDLEAWDAAKHNDKAKLSATRMAAGMILSLATAIGLALLFNWGNVEGVRNGITWGLVIALASGLPVLWYNWFYGTAPIWIFWVDSAHQVLGHAAVGAILAGWREACRRTMNVQRREPRVAFLLVDVAPVWYKLMQLSH